MDGIRAVPPVKGDFGAIVSDLFKVNFVGLVKLLTELIC